MDIEIVPSGAGVCTIEMYFQFYLSLLSLA